MGFFFSLTNPRHKHCAVATLLRRSQSYALRQPASFLQRKVSRIRSYSPTTARRRRFSSTALRDVATAQIERILEFA